MEGDGSAGANESPRVTDGDPHCPDCNCELVHGHDAAGYEIYQCPGCAKWKRPGWDELSEPVMEADA